MHSLLYRMYLRALNDSTESKNPIITHGKWSRHQFYLISLCRVWFCDLYTEIFIVDCVPIGPEWKKKKRKTVRRTLESTAYVIYTNTWYVYMVRQKAYIKGTVDKRVRWNKKLNSFCFESECSRQFIFADWKLIIHASYGNGKEGSEQKRVDAIESSKNILDIYFFLCFSLLAMCSKQILHVYRI